MEAERCGIWAVNKNGSQPYAKFYNVLPKMMDIDKKDPDIYSDELGYFQNETAKNLLDVITEEDIAELQKLIYVLDEENNIIVGERKNPNNDNKRSPHPALIGGKNPKVKCAGEIFFKDGKIYSINNSSGHFRPHAKSLDTMKEALSKLCNDYPQKFDKDFPGEKKSPPAQKLEGKILRLLLQDT